MGFTAQGNFEGSYYRRTEESYHDAEISWIFDGVADEDEDEEGKGKGKGRRRGMFGNFGLSGGGAAGYELDRSDVNLGSPETIRILARSENHQDHFTVVPEEMLTHITTTCTTPTSNESPKSLIGRLRP